jgi:hypothetical protein
VCSKERWIAAFVPKVRRNRGDWFRATARIEFVKYGTISTIRTYMVCGCLDAAQRSAVRDAMAINVNDLCAAIGRLYARVLRNAGSLQGLDRSLTNGHISVVIADRERPITLGRKGGVKA